jgi:transcriptional regulator with XRE-family HTH domain
MAHSLRAFLADQIRALRGDLSQKAFGDLIGKPQSVVSRLENEDYGKVTLQTLIDIAEKLDIALIVRFTDFPTFLHSTADVSESALGPRAFTQTAANEMTPKAGHGTAKSGR